MTRTAYRCFNNINLLTHLAINIGVILVVFYVAGTAFENNQANQTQVCTLNNQQCIQAAGTTPTAEKLKKCAVDFINCQKGAIAGSVGSYIVAEIILYVTAVILLAYVGALIFFVVVKAGGDGSADFKGMKSVSGGGPVRTGTKADDNMSQPMLDVSSSYQPPPSQTYGMGQY